MRKQDGISFAKKLRLKSGKLPENIEIGIAPSFTNLCELNKILKKTKIKLGAQNVFSELSGAHTGEVSAPQLKDEDVKFCIVGHSEMRAKGETDSEINKKIKILIKENITPVLCVGETLKQRNKKQERQVVQSQISFGLKDLNNGNLKNIIIAYEPIWAIGTGKTATPLQAQEMHKFIRSFISKNYSQNVGKKIRIIYGGSVNPENARELSEGQDIDGFLVGGASQKIDSFLSIIKNYYI